MPLTRRSFLRTGLAGGLLLAVGGAGLALQGTAIRRPARPLRCLDERSFAVLAAVADRIAPGRDGFPSASELHVAEKVDALLATLDPAMVQEVRQLLGLLENAAVGLLFDGRWRPFTRLPPEEQDEVLRAWQQSRLSIRRTGWAALHGLCSAAYYASPEVHARLGYPGPPDFGNLAGGALR